MTNDFVIDTCALVSLQFSEYFDDVINLGEWHTTQLVVDELQSMNEYDDDDANAAEDALIATNKEQKIDIHEIDDPGFQSSKIDPGEGSCIKLSNDHDVDYLVTDDHEGLAPIKYQTTSSVEVIHSPILFRALVKNGIMTEPESMAQTVKVAHYRSWISNPLVAYCIDELMDS